MKRLVICTPTHSNRAHVDYIGSVVRSICLLKELGVEVSLGFLSGSILPDLRSQMVTAALSNGASHLLMIDDDVAWPPDTPVRLLSHERDVVGCIVQTNDGQVHAVAHPRPAADAPNLLEVDAVGTSFLLLSRRCLERMEEAYPGHAFEFVRRGGNLHGEDYTFCCRWRGLGGRVFADPDPRIRHYGHACLDTTWAEAMEAGTAKYGRPLPPMLVGET